MQTLVIAKVKGILHSAGKIELRKKLIKEINEGLIVIDDSVEITAMSISGHVGLMFNIDEEEENEKSNIT